MYKFLRGILVVLVILCLASPGFCAANSWGNTDTNALLRVTVPSYLASLGVGVTASSTTLISPTIIIPLGYDIVKITAYTQTLTLPAGTRGQVLTLVNVGLGTAVTTILSPVQTGWSTITMDASGEQVTLRYVGDTLGWIIVGSVGATVNQQTVTQ